MIGVYYYDIATSCIGYTQKNQKKEEKKRVCAPFIMTTTTRLVRRLVRIEISVSAQRARNTIKT
jgi:hypothetical protein